MPSFSWSTLQRLLAVVTLVFLVAGIRAEVPAPRPPDRYDVDLRYSIDAPPTNRIPRFLEMLQQLKSVGFEYIPGPDADIEPEDRRFTTMRGTIASSDASKLLLVPDVQTVLLRPAGFKLPTEQGATVKVVMELASRLSPTAKKRLADEIRPYLKREGFKEALGYDHRGHSRLIGTIPAARYEFLLNDLRDKPTKDELREPLKSLWPIRLVTLTPEPEGVEPEQQPIREPAPPPGMAYVLKISRELRLLAGEDATKAKRTRLEVLLLVAPGEGDPSYERELLRAVPEAVIEHRFGSVIALTARPERAAELAKLPFVSAVRLPRPAAPPIFAPPGGLDRETGATGRQESAPPNPSEPGSDPNAKALRAWSLDRLHRQGARGQGLRVAVIGADFRSFQRFLGTRLPKTTRLIDVTAERTPTIEPEPIEGDPQGIGSGTFQALAAALAAPEAELTLIRIGNSAPYQLEMVLRWMTGQGDLSPALARRARELETDQDGLRLQRAELAEEGRALLNEFGQDEAAVQRRQAYFRHKSDVEAEASALQRRRQRYHALLQDLRSLRGMRLVSSALVWSDGYPVDGGSALVRRLDDDCRHAPMLWIQGAGDTQGQAWVGLFRDADDNGLMEFAPPDTPLRPERWSRELNFLAWQPHGAAKVLDLPAMATIRLSLQWREIHEPEYMLRGEDVYREPLVNLGLVVLRQRDPTGKKLPADTMELVARSQDLPYRIPQQLDVRRSSALCEQTLEFVAKKPGRYAVQIEGRAHPSTRPASVPTIPAEERFWELRPRLLVEALDTDSRSRGRPVWEDYQTGEGSVGMPAEAHTAVTIGASDPNGKARAYSSSGPPYNLALLPRPQVLVPDGLVLGDQKAPVRGTGVAAGFAAGIAASALTAGESPFGLFQASGSQAVQGWSLPGHGAPRQ